MARRSIVHTTGHQRPDSPSFSRQPETDGPGEPFSMVGPTPGRTRRDWLGRDAKWYAHRAFELIEQPGFTPWGQGVSEGKAKRYWLRALQMGYRVRDPNAEVVRALQALTGQPANSPGTTVSNRPGSSTNIGGGSRGDATAPAWLPRIDINWDDLAGFVEHDNPAGQNAANHFRLMGHRQQATGDPGEGWGQDPNGGHNTDTSSPSSGGDSGSGGGE